MNFLKLRYDSDIGLLYTVRETSYGSIQQT